MSEMMVTVVDGACGLMRVVACSKRSVDTGESEINARRKAKQENFMKSFNDYKSRSKSRRSLWDRLFL